MLKTCYVGWTGAEGLSGKNYPEVQIPSCYHGRQGLVRLQRSFWKKVVSLHEHFLKLHARITM